MMGGSLKLRVVKDRIFFFVVCLISAVTVVPLASILWELLRKGSRQINFNFFTLSSPSTLDAMMARANNEIIPGGIVNGITGTLLMVGLASFIAIPIGVMVGVYLSENYGKKFSSVVRFVTELLQGTPSIVLGIIAYAWVVKPITSGYSALAGSVALSIMMLPLIVRSTEESMHMLPGSLKEAGLALGASQCSVVFRILLPSAMGGLFTGILLSISRIMGETAPLLVTALGCQAVNLDITKPTSAVPLLIWEFYNDPNLLDMIWSSSLFLILLILFFNITAKRISKRWKI